MKTDDASAPCCAFSPDTTLMAAGFSESYIRLWSLKGENLRGVRNDKSTDSAKNCELPEVYPRVCILIFRLQLAPLGFERKKVPRLENW